MIQRHITVKRRRQEGFGVLSALLALVIGSIVSIGVIEGKSTEMQLSAGRNQGDLINRIKEAANTYAMENYPALQNNLPVTKAGVTLASGAGVGQSMSPRIQDLIAMGYLLAGTSPLAQVVDGGTYQIRFRQEPLGCVGAACNIPGSLYIDRAVLRPGTAEMNGVIVGAIMNRVGGDAMVSLNTGPGQLLSMSGAVVPNPVAGTPPGVVGSQVGFGAAGFGRFLVLNDPRDPNFQGNVTVAGTIAGGTVTAPNIVATNSVGAGSGMGGCRLGEILSSGQILSRAANCAARAWMDPATATVNVADAMNRTAVTMDGLNHAIRVTDFFGATSVTVDGLNGRIGTNSLAPSANPPGWQGGVTSRNVVANLAMGTWDDVRVRGSMDRNGNLDLFDAAGTRQAGVEISNGSNRITGQVVRAHGTGVAGAACGASRLQGDMAQNAAGTGIVMCDGATWVPVSLMSGVVGGACAPNGSVATTVAGVSLICSGNTWVTLADRMGRRVFAESWIVATNGAWIPKPACLSGTTGSMVLLAPKNEETQVRYVSRYAADVGAAWRAFEVDGFGNPIPGELLASTYCLY